MNIRFAAYVRKPLSLLGLRLGMPQTIMNVRFEMYVRKPL